MFIWSNLFYCQRDVDKLRILWLNHRDPLHPKAGGAERTIYEVAKRLIQKGNEVSLYCPKWEGSMDFEILDGIKIIRSGNNLSIHLILPIFLLKNKYDVIINDLAHGIPWITPTILGKKNIVFFRHLHARSLPGQVNFILAKIISFIEKLYPLLYRNDKIVTESSTSEEDLIGLGFLKENIIRIPPGVDLNLFFPGKKTKNVQLIYFGGFRKYKRPEFLLTVYEQLNSVVNNLCMVVTGEGKLLERIKQEAVSKNYNIRFTGKVGQTELANLIRESWINLHFSVTEGWGLSIIESSASGTPTIALTAPGVIDTVAENYNGFIVREIDQFRDKILNMIENEETFAKKSREFAERFDWEKTTNLWNELFHD